MTPRREHSPRTGFTLVEITVATALMSLLFLGAMTLYTAAFRSAAKSGAQITASQASATGLMHIEDEAREAYALTMPESLSNFGSTLGSSYQQADFRATYTDSASGKPARLTPGFCSPFP